jgi:phospholipid/cholesterol/gamma-HCH transport system substrate-binding protein
VVGGWFWVTRPDNDYFALTTVYDAVEGLSDQTPVRLQGFEVDRVQSITPLADSAGAVAFRVELRVEREFLKEGGLRIPRGTVARVTYPPVVGPPFILLEPPAEGGAPLQDGAIIPGQRTQPFLEQIQTLTGQLTYTVNETLARSLELMDSVESTLDRMNQTLATTSSAIPAMAESVDTSMANIQGLMAQMAAQMDTTAPAMRAAFDSASALLGDSRRVVGDLSALVSSSQPRTAAILANLDSLTYLLNHFTKQISERPTRLLTGVRPPPPMIR